MFRFLVRKWQKWEVQGQVGHWARPVSAEEVALRSDLGSMGEIPLLLRELAPFILDLGSGETSGKTGQLANRVEKTKREKNKGYVM